MSIPPISHGDILYEAYLVGPTKVLLIRKVLPSGHEREVDFDSLPKFVKDEILLNIERIDNAESET